jgi:transcriptional regulator with XRE-family HTH domain
MSTLGKNIVKMRVEKGMKQKELHAKAGLSQRYLSAVEHDKADPSISVVQRIARALGVQAAVLLYDLQAPDHGR